ncbi:hypothetical protein BDF22DRAFT_732813 [Syncephalis plumigaleata]|nr:hypothetical protein BDF22DRAFT_732813 [Syncephalis plumigaleata]
MKASLSVALLLASTAYAAPLLNGNLLSNINNNRAPHGLLSRVGVILAGDRSAPLVNADLKRHNSIKQSELPKDLGEVARDFEQLKRFETLQEAGEMRLKDEDFPGARALPKKQFEKAPGIQGLLSRLVRRGDYGSYGGHDDEEGEDDNDNKKDCKKDGGEEGDDDDNDDNDNDVGDYNGHGYQGGKRHDGEGNDDDDEGDDDDDDKDGYGRLGYGGNGNPKGKYNGSYNAGGEEGDNDDDDDDG